MAISEETVCHGAQLDKLCRPGATVRVYVVEHYLIDPLKSVSIVVKIAEEQRGAVDHEIGVLTGLLRHDNMAYCCVNC